jgi:transporter family-2 protein
MKTIMLMTFLPIFSGALICIQSGMSGQISKILGNPYMASFSIYLGCTLLMGLFFIVNPKLFPSLIDLRSVPIYLWIFGAVCSCIALCSIYWLMPIIGVPRLMVGVIFGQIIVSLIAGHFGFFGLPQEEISIGKVIGTILMLSGIIIINFEGKI